MELGRFEHAFRLTTHGAGPESPAAQIPIADVEVIRRGPTSRVVHVQLSDNEGLRKLRAISIGAQCPLGRGVRGSGRRRRVRGGTQWAPRLAAAADASQTLGHPQSSAKLTPGEYDGGTDESDDDPWQRRDLHGQINGVPITAQCGLVVVSNHVHCHHPCPEVAAIIRRAAYPLQTHRAVGQCRLDYWSRRKACGVSEAVRNGPAAWRVRRMLARL